MDTQSNGWIELPFEGGWTNKQPQDSQPPQSTGAYRLVGEYVELKGYIYDASYSSLIVCYLPEGFRPNTERHFVVHTDSVMGVARVRPDGAVLGNKYLVSLDSIRFTVS